MRYLLHLFLLLIMFFYFFNSKSQVIWEEKGCNPNLGIKQDIPAFDSVVVDYKRNGETVLTVRLDKPVIVDVATKPEKWGYFQFPNIYRLDENILIATWHMAEDAVTSYGKGVSTTIASYDNGKTWNPITDIPLVGGTLLPNGDRISVYTPKALDVKDLQLPDPLSSVRENYGRNFDFYKISDLPKELQGIYLSRLEKGGKVWITEQAILNDPNVVRYVDSGWFPVVWWGDMQIAPDGSVIAGVYPGFYIDENKKIPPSGVIFYRSIDYGKTWNYQGKITYQPDLESDCNGDKRAALGFTEPASILLKNGIYLCVMRTTDGLGSSPMYISSSTDLGVTWTNPKTFTNFGVLPKLLELENGAIVLASGRPGIQLRFATDGKGKVWTDPFEMLPFESLDGEVSCGYPDIIPSGSDCFHLIYSDFKYQNKDDEIRKAIKVRKVQVIPSDLADR